MAEEDKSASQKDEQGKPGQESESKPDQKHEPAVCGIFAFSAVALPMGHGPGANAVPPSLKSTHPR